MPSLAPQFAARPPAADADLAADLVLPADVAPVAPYVPVAAPADVLLTGGTGFLGAFVLVDLLRHTRARVHCLVRAADPAEARRRLLENLAWYGLSHPELAERVVALPGSVELLRFGLSEATYAALAEAVDTVYHLAASVSFMARYAELKATNVDGLVHVLRFACARRTKAVHHTSTYAVFNADAYALAETVYETELTGSSAGFRRGYDRSKWVAEHLARAARERGVPVSVHRVGFLSGSAETGVFNRMDPVALMFAVGMCTGQAFHIDALLHLTPVDFCSRALVEISLRRPPGTPIFHLVQEAPIPCEDLIAWLRGEGYPLRPVPFAEWLSGLKEACRRFPAFVPVLYLFSVQRSGPFGEDERLSALRFDAERVRRALPPELHCPPLTAPVLRRYFEAIADPARGYEVRR